MSADPNVEAESLTDRLRDRAERCLDATRGSSPGVVEQLRKDAATSREAADLIDRLRAFIRAFLDEEDEFPLTPEEHAAVASVAESLIGADLGAHTRPGGP